MRKRFGGFNWSEIFSVLVIFLRFLSRENSRQRKGGSCPVLTSLSRPGCWYGAVYWASTLMKVQFDKSRKRAPDKLKFMSKAKPEI